MKKVKPLLFIFLDGVGIGKKDYEHNPFFQFGFKTFEKHFGDIPSLENLELDGDGLFLFPSDACLGVAGLPQSGTGQASIFCGVNAPKIVGRHFGPYPYSTTIPIIKEKNLFKYYKEKGLKVAFANAYPKAFFDYIKRGKRRLSVTTMSCNFAGVRLRKASDLHRGRALSAELTNRIWRSRLKYKVPKIKPSLAAERLLRLASRNHFTAFEYFLSDHAGHRRLTVPLSEAVGVLDEFLYTVLKKFDREKLSLIICSDHGNLEDMSVKTHTFNPSLTITGGLKAAEIKGFIKNISQFKPAIIKYLF